MSKQPRNPQAIIKQIDYLQRALTQTGYPHESVRFHVTRDEAEEVADYLVGRMIEPVDRVAFLEFKGIRLSCEDIRLR